MKIRIGTSENEARYHHYAAVVESAEFEWLGTISPPFTEEKLAEIDAFIVSCDQHLPSRIAIIACKRLGIPTFHVLDGVVDWRTTFENPAFELKEGNIPLFQPLIADHVFAMGELQKWELMWLGNDSVYATGFPRFDDLERIPCRRENIDGHYRILVATANTPWVTPGQKEHLVTQFTHLHERLKLLTMGDPCCSITYRISGDLAAELGIEGASPGSAAEAIRRADAVITTPSTFAVEAILGGVPTLIFDPFALPVFTPAAWSATHWETILKLLPSLLSPTEPLASYQDQLCNLLVAPARQASAKIVEHICAVVGGSHHTGSGEARDPSCESASVTAFRQSRFGQKEWTPQQVSSIAATVAAMDKRVVDLTRDLQELMKAQSEPSLRFVLGATVRYLRRSFKGAR